MPEQRTPTVSRRTYLILKTAEDMSNPFTGLLIAQEAVASTALAHPEWDMDEKRTWEEWENDDST
jgi:hypothetical protein